MTFMHIGAITAAAAVVNPVTLSGGSASSNHVIFARAGFVFKAVGTVFSEDRGFFTQIFSETDWIIPHEDASVDYEIRYHFVGGVPLTAGPDAEDTWLTLDVDRTWFTNAYFSDPLGLTANIADIRWQDGTGPQNTEVSLWDGAPCMASAEYGTYVFAYAP